MDGFRDSPAKLNQWNNQPFSLALISSGRDHRRSGKLMPFSHRATNDRMMVRPNRGHESFKLRQTRMHSLRVLKRILDADEKLHRSK